VIRSGEIGLSGERVATHGKQSGGSCMIALPWVAWLYIIKEQAYFVPWIAVELHNVNAWLPLGLIW